MKRNVTIDIMKGIGILLVIIGHSTNIGRFLIYSFHMPLFFILSGYFFKPEKSFGEIITKGFKSLLIPFIVTGFCVGLFYCITVMITGGSVQGTVQRWITAVLMGLGSSNISAPNAAGIEKIGAIWFFEALFWARLYLFFVLKSKYIFLQTTILFLMCALVVATRKIYWLPANIGPGLAGGVFMYAGYMINKLQIVQKKEKPYWIFIAIAVTVVTVMMDLYVGKRLAIATLSFPLYGFDLLAAISGTYVVLCIARFIQRVARGCSSALELIGKSTTEVLCVHLFDLNCIGSIIPGGLIRLVFRLLFDVGGGIIIKNISLFMKYGEIQHEK